MKQFITKVPVLFLLLIFVIPFCMFAQTENWLYQYDGPMSDDDAANAIVFGADGNIYVAGYSHDNGTDTDLLVISLTTSGDTNWVYLYNGPDDNNEVANAIVYGTDGNIYVAGYIMHSPIHTTDLVVISLEPIIIGAREVGVYSTKCNMFGPTVFNGPLQLPKDKNYRVFDITGRITTPDKIRPGIYFIEVDGVVTQKVIKVK